MCLGIPGRVESIEGQDPLTRVGKVSFGGTLRDVYLAYTPDVQPGDYVIVHVGFAISTVDPEEADRVFRYLREIGEDEVPG